MNKSWSYGGGLSGLTLTWMVLLALPLAAASGVLSYHYLSDYGLWMQVGLSVFLCYVVLAIELMLGICIYKKSRG